MKVGVDDYIRKRIVVNVIDREGDLFLYGMKTLQEWKVAVFYERNEMEFNLTKKRVFMEMSKRGHQYVKLEVVGEWTNAAYTIWREKKRLITRVQ